MKILLTQRDLTGRAGAELFVVETALELRRRGHEVAIYCPRIGKLGSDLRHYGVHVEESLDEVPWRPDVIHGQHHLQAMAALVCFAGVPLIYCSHGVFPWPERPPLHRGICRYVVMCDAMVDGMVCALGIPRELVTVVPNFVNLERFSRVRTPPEHPRRALAFGNSFRPGDQIQQLKAMCATEGIELDAVGLSFGNAHSRPEHLLLDYDLVFAVGKCAIEALASGCAVIPVAEGLGGALIATENFARWAASNFAPRLFSPADRMDLPWLQRELARYDADQVTAASHRLRAEHSLQGGVDKLEAVYQRAIDFRSSGGSTSQQESQDTGLYLEKIAGEMDARAQASVDEKRASERQQGILQKRIRQLENDLQKREQKIATLQSRWEAAAAVLRRSPVGRWFLRRIHRSFSPGEKPAKPEG